MATQMPKFGLAIDWETSGLSLPPEDYAAKHQGIAFAAVVFDASTYEVVDVLYKSIKFDSTKYQWTDKAESIHGLSRTYLEEHGCTQEEAAIELAQMVFKYMGSDEIVILGHRPHFDISFTDQLMSSVDMEFKYDPIKIDTAALGFIFLELTHSDELFDAMGLKSVVNMML